MSKNQIQAVLFDLDETLLNRTASLRSFIDWQVKGMLCSQISDRDSFLKRFIELDANGRVWKDRVYEISIDEFEISGWSIEELTTSYELCFSRFCQPKQGAIEAVKVLSQVGLKLGLISNGRSLQERNFNSLGISSLFNTVIVSEAVRLRKPDRAIFELAVAELEVKFGESAFVGDNPVADIKGAKDVGMYSIYIPGNNGETCDAADLTCNDFWKLPDIIRLI